MSKIIKYFVEGECEETLLNLLKAPPLSVIKPGRVEVFNVIQRKLDEARIMQLKKDTIVVFVYDTDIEKTDVLDYNIKFLNKFGFKTIYHIQSVLKFEDEIVRSTSIKRIEDLFKTQSKDEFKSEFIHCGNIYNKLRNVKFDIKKMWRKKPNNCFSVYYNEKYLKVILEKE